MFKYRKMINLKFSCLFLLFMKSVDLHLHTIYSDGTCTPTQIVKDCGLNRIEVIALADHDSTSGFEEGLIEAKKIGIKLITGVEISTPKYHILGYDFDIENKVIQNALKYSRGEQEKIVQKRIDNIRKHNIPITLEKVKYYSQNARLGKGNVALAMIYDSECRKIIGDMNIENIIDKYMKKGSMEYDKSISELTPKDAIYAIKKSGGVAILAHPFKDLKSFDDLDDLIKLGLDGLEIQPTFGKRNDEVLKIAKERNLMITYGSDFHGSKYINRPMLNNSYKIKEFWNR